MVSLLRFDRWKEVPIMPYLYYISAGILLAAVLITIVVVVLLHTGKNKKIDLSYHWGNGQILVHGVRKEYAISMEEEYEFLVQNDRIVSARCKKHGDKLISYNGGDKV